MRSHSLEFNHAAIRPLACLSDGWRILRGEYWLFVAIVFVGIFVGSMAPMGLLIAPAMCGIHLCFLRRERDLPVRFEMLFDGFNYFLQSLIATLVITAPMMIIFFVGYMAAELALFGFMILLIPPPQPGQPPPPDPEIGMIMAVGGCTVFLICVGIGLVLQTLTIFVYPLIVDRELPGFQAVKLSCQAALANVWGILGLLLLRLALDIATSLVCCVGPILFMPLDLAMIAIAYRQVFPDEDPYGEIAADEPMDDRSPAPAQGIKALPG